MLLHNNKKISKIPQQQLFCKLMNKANNNSFQTSGANLYFNLIFSCSLLQFSALVRLLVGEMRLRIQVLKKLEHNTQCCAEEMLD